MSVNELYQAIQDIMSNKADNLSNRQKALFIDMRQAYALQEYLKNMESIYKGSTAPALEIPGTIKNAADTSPKREIGFQPAFDWRQPFCDGFVLNYIPS